MHINNLKIKINFLLIGLGIFVSALTFSNSSTPVSTTEKRYSFKQHQNQSAEAFYKKQCGFCHTSEELIAPDMKKIKVIYLKKYKTKEAFINAVYKFVKNPNKNKSIYKEGIENFMDMPKMPFKDEQIKAVAEYIFKNTDL